MTNTERNEWRMYLRHCTTNQVLACLEKEITAERLDYAAWAEAELERRGYDFVNQR